MSPASTRLAAVLAVLLLAGCASSERRYWELEWLDSGDNGNHVLSHLGGSLRRQDWTGAAREIGPRDLADGYLTVHHENGTRARIRPGRELVGHEVAGIIGEALRRVEHELGMESFFEGIYVVVEGEDQPTSCTIDSYLVGDRSFPVPLFGRRDQGPGDLLIDNQFLIAIWIHEFFEGTLVFPERPPTVLPDGQIDWYLLRPGWTIYRRKSVNGTRWFRDGLSNLAALRMMEHVTALVREKWPDVRTREWEASRLASLTKLSRVGTDLLDWHQFSPDSWAGDYYPAACALLLLLEEEHGPEVLSGILKSIGDVEFPDGPALERVLQERIGVSIRVLLEGFELETGLDLEPSGVRPELVVAAGSPGARAGFRTGDRLVAVDGTATTRLLDLELALHRTRGTGVPVRVKIDRQGEGTEVSLTVD